MGFEFPHNVMGWLSEFEGEALSRLAEGNRVLEIGSYCGRSTICLASTALSVYAVDPHDGRGTPLPMQTRSILEDNLRAHGINNVTIVESTAMEFAESDFGPPFDLIFIDGAHDYASVASDIAVAQRLIARDGLIVFHDYRSSPSEHGGRDDPGVRHAVDELVRGGAKIIDRFGTLAVVSPRDALPFGRRRRAFLLQPFRSTIHPESDKSAEFCTEGRSEFSVMPSKICNSMICPCFNAGVALCKRGQFDYFAMLHSDVITARGWLATLADDMESHGLDIIHAPVAIKDMSGKTSTAYATTDNHWDRKTNLSIASLSQLPPVFTVDDVRELVGADVYCLLPNTGCMVIKIGPWFREWPGFCTHDDVQLVDGEWQPRTVSEDWVLGFYAAAHGLRVGGSTNVRTRHVGDFCYTTEFVWGDERIPERSEQCPADYQSSSSQTVNS